MPLKKSLGDMARELRERGVPEVDIEELLEMSEEESGLVVIDVREHDEHGRGAIPGAVHVSRGVLERDIEKAVFNGQASDADLDRPIVCYCGGGSRSLLSTHQLREMGFTNVHSLEGGFRAWVESGGDVDVKRST